jgi:hypothetical protein
VIEQLRRRRGNLNRTLKGGDGGEVIRKKGKIAGVGEECWCGCWIASCLCPTTLMHANFAAQIVNVEECG